MQTTQTGDVNLISSLTGNFFNDKKTTVPESLFLILNHMHSDRICEVISQNEEIIDRLWTTACLSCLDLTNLVSKDAFRTKQGISSLYKKLVPASEFSEEEFVN